MTSGNNNTANNALIYYYPNVTSSGATGTIDGRHTMNANSPAQYALASTASQQGIITLDEMQRMMGHHQNQVLLQQPQQQMAAALLTQPVTSSSQQVQQLSRHQMQIQEPVQVQSHGTWNPIPAQSRSMKPKNVDLNSGSGLKTVTSQGVLLPLVNVSEKPNENPTNQMQQCMGIIESALRDPCFADAGKVLLEAMQASSTYIGDMMEQKQNQEQQPIQEHLVAPAPILSVNPVVNPVHKKLFPGMGEAVTTPTSFDAPIQVVAASSTHAPPTTTVKAAQAQSSPVRLPAILNSLVTASKIALHTNQHSKPKVHKASCGMVEKSYRPKPLTSTFEGSPQQYLETILKERGYPTQKTCSFEAGYHTDPSPLQVASFGTVLVHAAQTSNTAMLAKLVQCGLSPNPCNQFGDSILSHACKRADYAVLQVLVENGCDLTVCDSFGRTPLHNFAWAKNFDKNMAKTILDGDVNQLLIQDKRGQCPLESIRKNMWGEWNAFLRDHMDVYWPMSGRPLTRPFPRDLRGASALKDPTPALSIELATQVSSGQLSPEDASTMNNPSTSTVRMVQQHFFSS